MYFHAPMHDIMIMTTCLLFYTVSCVVPGSCKACPGLSYAILMRITYSNPNQVQDS